MQPPHFRGLQVLDLVLFHFSVLLLDINVDISFLVSSYAQMTHTGMTPDKRPSLSIRSECPLDITEMTRSHPQVNIFMI